MRTQFLTCAAACLFSGSLVTGNAAAQFYNLPGYHLPPSGETMEFSSRLMENLPKPEGMQYLGRQVRDATLQNQAVQGMVPAVADNSSLMLQGMQQGVQTGLQQGVQALQGYSAPLSAAAFAGMQGTRTNPTTPGMCLAGCFQIAGQGSVIGAQCEMACAGVTRLLGPAAGEVNVDWLQAGRTAGYAVRSALFK